MDNQMKQLNQLIIQLIHQQDKYKSLIYGHI